MQWFLLIFIIPYLYLLIGIYIRLNRIVPYSAAKTPDINVSVIVACLNEEKHLPFLLDCLSKQDYKPHLFELIIVDDSSTDNTFTVASEVANIRNIKVLRNQGEGKKQALKTGVHASSGHLILTTDADCRMGKSWIRTIAAYYEMHKPDMIICPVQLEQSPGLFGKFQELEFLGLQGITAGTVLAGKGTMCNGANLAFTKEAYMNNETDLNFEIPSGDDIFFLHSLKKQKGSAILWLESIAARVTTEPAPSAGSYLRQRRRWISKSRNYKDRFSILLGIVTLVTILFQLFLLVIVFLNQAFLPLFAAIFIIKSVPDYLILHNTSCRYERLELMNWFIPAQALYPFYVLIVFFYSLISPRNQ
jgi:poly-beta-1,6-N-acetyl-D-glucosamine synthase